MPRSTHMGKNKPKQVATMPFEDMCEVKFLPGLGMEGVVAKSDIDVNTCIAVSSPLWCHCLLLEKSFESTREALLDSFNKYCEQAEAVLAYSSTLSPQFHPPMTRAFWIEEIHRTNCWTSRWNSTCLVTSMPNGSKFNHSCAPNLHVYVDHTQFRVTAVENIASGESMTVSYMGNKMVEQTLEDRREVLIDWDFHCMCTRCVIEETVLHMIDLLERQTMIHM